MGASQLVSQKSIYEFTVKDAKGKDVNLSTYKGKVILVVNVASKCGFTNVNLSFTTYTKIEFLSQEPGNSREAEQFACTRFKAEYPIFGKGKGAVLGVAVAYGLLWQDLLSRYRVM